MRCFVGIDLDPEFRERVAEIQRKLVQPGLKMVKPESLHITLKFLGELDEQQIKDVIHKLKNVMFSGFEIELKDIGVFPDPRHIRVVWIDVESEELQALTKQIISKLAEYGHDDFGVKRILSNQHISQNSLTSRISAEMQDFKAHLTLARVDRVVPGLAEKIECMAGVKIGRQKVINFRLKKSALTPKGPVYSDIEVFDLC